MSRRRHVEIEVPAGGRDVADEVLQYRVGPAVNYTYMRGFRGTKLVMWGEKLSDDMLRRLGDACNDLEREYADMAMYEAASDADSMAGRFVFHDEIQTAENATEAGENANGEK